LKTFVRTVIAAPREGGKKGGRKGKKSLGQVSISLKKKKGDEKNTGKKGIVEIAPGSSGVRPN